ncbi:hypothetical protein NliqN6_1982 [Naganishia liquefaciens]|uniref:Uncharacterized protein n=1 Tax=Naganishia liquefaciens TaxID=104408 RepID=A0A8H3TQY4_9TREE|nr:hypothetical protein NliqN6_1982 [Naganishia liquefaciens]
MSVYPHQTKSRASSHMPSACANRSVIDAAQILAAGISALSSPARQQKSSQWSEISEFEGSVSSMMGVMHNIVSFSASSSIDLSLWELPSILPTRFARCSRLLCHDYFR